MDLEETLIEPGSARATPDAGARGPDKIGRYSILGVLGRGGMGLVYKGYDAELDRRVAIKVFHRNRDGDGSQVHEIHQRAMREAQALARLSHANIVAVHEVGSFEGQIFIVMEYVRGETLRAWLARRPLLARVLDVFLQIGRALAAAHRAGIVHRDLKPENVVVTGDGRAQVLDFGLARTSDAATDQAMLQSQPLTPDDGTSVTISAPGDLIGTPAYMAPEQLLRERACERSDQYALCVCLHEALYGVRPFVAPTVEGLRLAVLKGELRTAERPLYPVPSYLRAAILRGLSFDREKRFPNIDALLAVLVDGKRRRRQRGLLLGGLGLAAGLAVVAGALWAADARAHAVCKATSLHVGALWLAPTQQQVRERMVATGLGFAETSFERLSADIDRFVAEWSAVSELLCVHQDIDGSWDEATAARARACLEEGEWALAGLVSVLLEAGPTVVQRSTHAAATLPRSAACLRPELQRQRAPRAGLLGERARSAVALAEVSRARSFLVTAQYAELEALTKTLLHAGGPRPDGRLEAELQHLHGIALYRLQQVQPAEDALYTAAKMAMAVAHDGLLAEAFVALAHVTGYLAGRHAEGLRWGELALTLSRRMGAEGRLHQAHALSSLASVHLLRGELTLAEQQIREAVELLEAELGPEHPEVIDGLSNLAILMVRRQPSEEALELALRVLENRRRTRGARHPATLSALGNVAAIQAELRRYDASVASFRAALALLDPRASVMEMVPLLDSLGYVQSQRNELGAAETLLRRSIALLEAAGAPEHMLASPLGNLGATLIRDGRAEEARRVLTRALALREQTLGPHDAGVAEILVDLAAAEAAIGDGEAARGMLERALKIVETREASPRLVGRVRFDLGRMQWAAQPDPRALDLVRAARAADPEETKIREWLALHDRGGGTP